MIGILLVIGGGVVVGLAISATAIAITIDMRRRREALAARDQVGRLCDPRDQELL